MARIRRTPYAFFYLEDDYSLDVAAVLSGEVPQPEPEAKTLALVLLTGERHALGPSDLETLRHVPSSLWIDDDRLDPDIVRSLVDRGLLLSEAGDDRLRRRDESLAANEWNLYAALYHFMTQWTGVDVGAQEAEQLRAQAREAAQAFVAEHGPPPDAFADSPTEGDKLQLPATRPDGELYRTLLARRTTRAFDPDVAMTIDELGTVLHYVFGCHGYGTTVADVVSIKRTSPSGGGLHPIEAYPIVSNVAGVEPGIYRYSVRDHSIVRLSALHPDEARRMATAFMCGQNYFGAAHVSFVLTARFYRNHWKYRQHQKAYAGILMDAAHLSQTLYLVSTELGLGAFVTLAVNGLDIEKRLGLDGVSEGVIAMTGCGPPAPGVSPLELQFTPGAPPAAPLPPAA